MPIKAKHCVIRRAAKKSILVVMLNSDLAHRHRLLSLVSGEIKGGDVMESLGNRTNVNPAPLIL